MDRCHTLDRHNVEGVPILDDFGKLTGLLEAEGASHHGCREPGILPLLATITLDPGDLDRLKRSLCGSLGKVSSLLDLGTDRLAGLIDLIGKFLQGSGTLLALKLLLGGGKFHHDIGDIARFPGNQSLLVLLVERGGFLLSDRGLLGQRILFEAENLRGDGLIDACRLPDLGLPDGYRRGDDTAQLAHLDGVPDELLELTLGETSWRQLLLQEGSIL